MPAICHQHKFNCVTIYVMKSKTIYYLLVFFALISHISAFITLLSMIFFFFASINVSESIIFILSISYIILYVVYLRKVIAFWKNQDKIKAYLVSIMGALLLLFFVYAGCSYEFYFHPLNFR